jgi:DHA1 family tetracycline resistance protein-like MFS transporter
MRKPRPLLAIFCVIFVDILAFTLVLPYLPFYAEKYGASPVGVGLLITAFAFCQFLSGPILGKLSDEYGRKPILILSQIGTLIGFIILAFAHSLWLIYLARIVDGITAGNITVAQAAISDVTPPKERAKAFGLIGIAFGFGFFIGPAIAGFLVRFGFAAPAWGAAFFSFCSIIATITLFEDRLPAREDGQTHLPQRLRWQDLSAMFDLRPIVKYLKVDSIRSALLQFFIFSLSFSAIISGFAMFAERKIFYHGRPFGATEVSYLYAYLGLIGIAVRVFLITFLINRFGERKTAKIGFLSQGLGYLGYAFTVRIPSLVLSATFGNLGAGLVRPAIMATISANTSPREQGAVFGVAQSINSIASIIAPMIAGLLLAHVSPESWAIFCGGTALIALAL